jgi:hypothetical protein
MPWMAIRAAWPVEVAAVVGAAMGTDAIGSHARPVARAVAAPVDARTGRRALTHSDALLDLAS